MTFGRRLLRLLGLLFATVIAAKVVHAFKPQWDHYVSVIQALIIAIIGTLTLKEFLGILYPGTAVRALREAAQQLREQERQAFFQIEEERRLLRNARQRERRAAQRAERGLPPKVPAKPAFNPSTKEAAPEVVGKSRWDRLLEDDEE